MVALRIFVAVLALAPLPVPPATDYPALVLVERSATPSTASIRLKSSPTLRPALASMGVRFSVADPARDPGWSDWLLRTRQAPPVAVYLDGKGKPALRWSGPLLAEPNILAGIRGRAFPSPVHP